MIEGVAVAGVGTLPSQRRPAREVTTPALLSDALGLALADAGMRSGEIDGLGVASFSLRPDRAIDFAWHSGLRLRWLMDDVMAMNLVHHAVRALQAGDASAIAIVGGDNLLGADYGELVDNYNRATRDYLGALPTGGPNPLFALVTQRHMASRGLERADYGRVVVSQRAWAATNPNAAYRQPLSLDEYLGAPQVAYPLCLYDCPPPVAAAEALILTASERSMTGRRRVEIRAIASSFGADIQEGEGLETGLVLVAEGLWAESGIGPRDLDVVELYDDYPVMVLVQLRDLGVIGDGDAEPLLRGPGRSVQAVNTGGGLLCAGQAGAGGGLQAIVEAARQLRGERGDGQVASARTAVAAGYGMVLYRYAACSVAAVLEAAG
jgi:acetyl-CoA acetyltransferase